MLGQRGASPFVGRQRELVLLEAQLTRARQGKGTIALVGGEPGIGKTRLLTELAAWAQAGGSLVLIGHAYESDGGLPYAPFVEALRSYVRTADPDTVRTLMGSGATPIALLLPELHDRFPDLPLGRVDSPELDRTRLFDAVVDLLFAAAHSASGGLLLALEDLHWADAASLTLLQHLGRRLAEAPLLLAVTYRTVDVPRAHPLHAVLAELTRQQPVERLRLQPLPQPEVAGLMAALTGAPAAPGVVERVYTETEGNPFFVTEVVRQLAAEGVDLTSAAGMAAGWSVPEGVRQVIGSRLSRLSEAANDLLRAAAVLDAGFRFEVLVALHGGTATALLAPLEEVLGAGLLQEQTGGYDFAHALIRQTLGDELSLPRRQLLHLRAAEAIEQVYAGNLAPHLSALAEHNRLAGAVADPQKAIDYLQRAGAAAQASFAYETAAAQWRAALALMAERGTDSERRADLLYELGDLLYATGFPHYAEAIACLEQALPLCEAAGRPELAAKTHARLAGYLGSSIFPTMDLPRALAHLRSAELVLSSGPVSPALGSFYENFGIVAVMSVRIDEGLAAAERARAIAEALEDEEGKVRIACHLGSFLAGSGRLREGFASFERGWEAGHRLNYALGAFLNALWSGGWATALNDPLDAIRCLEREVDQPRLAQAVTRRQLLLSVIAWARSQSGDLAGARRLVAELGSVTFEQQVVTYAQAALAFYGGDWEATEGAWRAASEHCRRAGHLLGQIDYAYWLARLRRLQDDDEQAEMLLHQATRIAAEGPLLIFELRSRASLATLCAEAGRVDDAQPHLDRCLEILAGGEDWRGLTGAVRVAAGVVDAARGQRQEAEARFDEALQTYRRYKLPWDEAETLHRWGRALVGLGDQHQDLAQFGAALDVYARLQASERWRGRVLRDMEQAAGRRATVTAYPRYPDGLSEREVEVLRLLAGGKTNREIAAALVVSANTVAFHVKGIFNKTGVANRTEAAAYAHRLHLVAQPD